jgi:signal transduction histidine kinase
VNRVVALLVAAAFGVQALGALDRQRPSALLAGLAFTVLATAGFRLVRDRRIAWRCAYFVFQLVLGYGMFGLSDAGVGATLLLVLLAVQAVLSLPLRLAVPVCVVIPFAHTGMGWADAIREGLGLAIGVLLAAMVTRLLMREQGLRAELAAANIRLQELAGQAAELATTRERNRVARDIHDGLGHHLTVVQMQVKAGRALLPGDPARADAILGKAERQAEEALAEVRRSVGALREPRPRQPLAEALGALAEAASAAGPPTELVVIGTARELTDDAEEALFRAAQEGLTNVRKHAGAATARLLLDFAEPSVVRLEVHDDGAGPDPGHPPGFGLVGLAERLSRLHGTVTMAPGAGGGAELRVVLPG